MTKDELIDKTDEVISEIIFPKTELLKAYNYYNGIRDPELFRYLEENFGIGSPTSVEFTPLLKKHVDALVGEYLGTPILPKISCKDTETISAITREKQLKIESEVVQFLKKSLHSTLIKLINGKDDTDANIQLLIDKIIQDTDLTFVSSYEIAAQNIVLYIMLSRETDIITKLRLLLTDLLITGYTYFRVKTSLTGTNISIEVLDPLNTFTDRNIDSPYVKHSTKAVVRKWMTHNLILAKYGKELSKKDVEELKDRWKEQTSSTKWTDTPYISTRRECYNIIPGYPIQNKLNLIPVYEVEWIETDNNFVMQRYSTVRIGEEMYITRGIDKNIIRSQDNPNFCTLTVNGVFFLNRSQEPYSLILKCAAMLDKYDILHYYRDRLIANSGSAGAIMDVSLLPTFLGPDIISRILKWQAYRKAGTTFIDTTMEGRADNGNQPINTIFNGYDDTLKAQAVQAIEMAIQSVESTVSSITGVFRERLNGIEQRDAVTNIKQGVNNSFIITKHYYQLMDLITCEILLDSLNQAKITYKQGLTGTIILGDKYQKIFTALPEHFTLTDFDIHITSSTEVMLDLQTLKQAIPDFIKSQQLSPDIIFEALTTKSLTDLKYKVLKAMKILKEENNLIQLLSLKLQEAELQALQLLKELEKTNLKLQQLDERKMQIEQLKIQLEYQVNWYKAQSDRTFKDRQMDIQEKRTDLEIMQLRDGNPYNDTIKLLM